MLCPRGDRAGEEAMRNVVINIAVVRQAVNSIANRVVVAAAMVAQALHRLPGLQPQGQPVPCYLTITHLKREHERMFMLELMSQLGHRSGLDTSRLDVGRWQGGRGWTGRSSSSCHNN